MKLSIIYNISNNSKNLINSLNSLVKIDSDDFEIIFILNTNNMDVFQNSILKVDFKNKKTSYVFLNQNLGHSYAYNIGQKLAIGEYVYFVGSKNIFKRNFMKELNELTNDKVYDVIILIDGGPIKFTKENYIKNINTDLMNIKRKIINRDFLNKNKITFYNYKYYNQLYLFDLNEKVKEIGYINKNICDFITDQKSNYNLYDILGSSEILFKKISKSNFNSDKKDYYNMTIAVSILYEFIYKIFKNYSDKNVIETAIFNANKLIDKIYPDYKKNKFLMMNRYKEIPKYILDFKPTIKYCKQVLEII